MGNKLSNHYWAGPSYLIEFTSVWPSATLGVVSRGTKLLLNSMFCLRREREREELV